MGWSRKTWSVYALVVVVDPHTSNSACIRVLVPINRYPLNGSETRSLSQYTRNAQSFSYLSYGILSSLVNIQCHCHSASLVTCRPVVKYPLQSQDLQRRTHVVPTSISKVGQECALSTAGCSWLARAPSALSHISRIGCL